MINSPVLDRLGFTKGDGLCHSIEDATNNYERLYMSEALKLDTDVAVYFRRFYKNNTPTLDNSDSEVAYSQPAVYIFNKKEDFFDSEPHKKLHAALWSAGQAEVYIILTDTRIDIINSRQPAMRLKDKKDVTLDDDVLKLASDVIEKFNNKRFSAHLFGNGTFWEQSERKNNLNENKSPYFFLLDYLIEARKIITNENSDLEASTIDKLLVVSILSKFLEEKKDLESGRHTLSKIYEKYGVESFEEVIKRKLFINILGKLANRFNGQIFDKFDDKEKKQIKKAELNPIAQFLSAEISIKNRQLFLWKQYSFEHLPTEVISAIYENFIQADALRTGEVRKDIVYTPIHLVNLLIDESMSLDEPELFENEKFKVLDPACGSGVFLVAAYKRMLQWYAINHYNKTGKVSYPDKEIAQRILENNIFGVDIEETAAFVSVFSLTTAFLDKLDPKETWENLKFKNLSEENIQDSNFVDWARKNISQERGFDLVIGNPPFNDSKKGTITNEDVKDLFKSKVPGGKLDLKFLEAALHFGKKVSMIIRSNIILYNKFGTSQRYRNRIFTNYTVKKIFDFTHLRRMLFRGAVEVPIIAISIDNQPSNQQPIQHVIVKREYFSEKRIRFEIDYYDYHKVPWRWAVNGDKQFVWKTNLIGGGQLFHLIYRLSLLRTFGGIIEEKRQENLNWKKPIRGYDRGSKINLEHQDEIIGIDQNNQPIILKNTTIEADNLKDEFMYKPPFLMVEQVLGLPKKNLSACFVSHKNQFTNKPKLYYNRDFVGISVPKKEENSLREVFDSIKQNSNSLNYQLYVLAISGNCLVSHETAIRQEDITSLPFPEDKKYLKLSKTEKIIQEDALQYYIHLGKGIDEGLAGHPLHQPPKEEPHLKAFGETYCDSLNEIYAEDNNSWQIGEIIHTDTFISYQFGFGENGGLKYNYENEDKVLDFKSLLENDESNRGVMYKRIIQYHDHVNGYDCIYFIKPNSLRYWLRSIALRDADDTFVYFKDEGF